MLFVNKNVISWGILVLNAKILIFAKNVSSKKKLFMIIFWKKFMPAKLPVKEKVTTISKMFFKVKLDVVGVDVVMNVIKK